MYFLAELCSFGREDFIDRGCEYPVISVDHRQRSRPVGRIELPMDVIDARRLFGKTAKYSMIECRWGVSIYSRFLQIFSHVE